MIIRACDSLTSRAKLALWELYKGFMKRFSKSQCAMKKFKNTKIEVKYVDFVLDGLEIK